jgi:hypothetical protein
MSRISTLARSESQAVVTLSGPGKTRLWFRSLCHPINTRNTRTTKTEAQIAAPSPPIGAMHRKLRPKTKMDAHPKGEMDWRTSTTSSAIRKKYIDAPSIGACWSERKREAEGQQWNSAVGDHVASRALAKI